MRDDEQPAVCGVHEGGNDVLVVLHVDDDADRLAVAAPAGQPVGADRVELAAGGEDEDLVRGLRGKGQLERVAFLEGQRRIVGQMAFHRPQPAFFRHDHRHRLALDHGMVNVGQVVLGRFGELGAALADLGFRSKFFTQFLDLPFYHGPLLGFRAKQRLDLLLFLGKGIEFLADFEFLKLAQVAQAHVQDGFGLQVGKVPTGHHHLLGLVILADDADHLVDVEVGDQVAAKDFQPALDLAEAMLGTADQHVAAMVEPFLQHVP